MTPGRFGQWARVVARLGVRNVAAVAYYRYQKRRGALSTIPSQLESGLYFSPPIPLTAAPLVDIASLRAAADTLLAGRVKFFGGPPRDIGSPPDWFLNPYNGQRYARRAEAWAELPDFDPEFGDIKIAWELSRFAWAPTLARAWRATGDARYLNALNAWTLDWVQKNPVGLGPQWKCGQETGLRALHLCLAERILGDTLPSPALNSLLRAHANRIVPTLRYAAAQRNNHILSEATALFVIGLRLGDERLKDLGHATLHRYARKLFENDGTFSQYSVNYHRHALDLLSHATLWARDAGEQVTWPHAEAATRWLESFVDPKTGRVPNLGANDGSHILSLDDLDARDFRASVQLASILFLKKRAYPAGPWDATLRWRRVSEDSAPIVRNEREAFPEGGFHVWRQGDTRAFFRTPKFHFRPSQADALHFDLWHRGSNIARDAGTYSYLLSEREARVYSGVQGHNTVQFDDYDQMPKLGRFLYADWLQVSSRADDTSWTAAYLTSNGAKHERVVSWSPDGLTWTITDTLSGRFSDAILRWHLMPADWKTHQHDVWDCDLATISIEGDGDRIVRWSTGAESEYYLDSQSVPVLETRVKHPTRLVTRFTLKAAAT